MKLQKKDIPYIQSDKFNSVIETLRNALSLSKKEQSKMNNSILCPSISSLDLVMQSSECQSVLHEGRKGPLEKVLNILS